MPLNLTRSLLVVLIPGGIALFPWVLWPLSSDERFAKFYGTYEFVRAPESRAYEEAQMQTERSK